MSTQEPATRHFTAAELASFLENLEAQREPTCTPDHAVRSVRLRVEEPETVLGHDPLSSVGAPVWRAPLRRPARSDVRERPAPQEPSAQRARRDGDSARRAKRPAAPVRELAPTRFACDARRTELLLPPPLSFTASPFARNARDAPSSFALTLAESPCARSFRDRRWRRAFFVVLCVCIALWAGLCARRVARPGAAGEPERAAPRAPDTASIGHATDEAERSPAFDASRTQADQAPATAVHGLPALAAAARVDTFASPPHVMRADAASTAQRVERGLSEAARGSARRRAVDLLLAGRTRQALDVYRGWLASAHADAIEASAVQQLVQLLERELSACERLLGSPCGF